MLGHCSVGRHWHDGVTRQTAFSVPGSFKALTFRITDAIDSTAEIVRILLVKGNAFHINSSFILPKVLNPQEEMGLLELLQPFPHLRGKFA